MSIRRIRRRVFTAFCWFGLLIQSALSQNLPSNDACHSYYTAIAGDQSVEQLKVTSAINDSLLIDWSVAVPCIVRATEAFRPEVNSPNIPPLTLGKLLRATGAMRTIMGNKKNDEDLQRIIKLIRTNMNLDVTTVLSYGARSDNYDLRLNSILILANVIDNSTLCVPLDHLYDPQISDKGRANLLGVVSVVAPWAYYENYNNITKIVDYTRQKINGRNDLGQTNDILQNIKSRQNSQTDSTNKNVHISAALGAACKSYRATWAPSGYLLY